MTDTAILDLLEVGQIARLIPSVSDSKREERATASLLATFMIVPAYAQEVLSDAGAPIGKRVKITCLTEVVFKTKGERRPRPDGLIIVTSGSRTWTAIVESKVGTSQLSQDQIEEYLDLAKEIGINALITISNQFATLPTHHPVRISKQKTRSVSLYHFSWLGLISKAILVSESKSVEDKEQGYILSELVRYMQHDASGITSLAKMGSGWKDVCTAIQQGAPLNRNSEILSDSVASWHQLLRYLAIQLSVAIGKPVMIALNRARYKDAELNFNEDVSSLLKENRLEAEFDVPNAATKLVFSADFLRRTINLSMKLDAPKDRTRSTAVINWLVKQIRSTDESDLSIRAYWPRRIPMTSEPLINVLENPAILVPENVSELPVALEVVRVVDLAGRFKGAKTFVEESAQAFPQFYAKVGQLLTKWVPKPPKVKESEPKEDITSLQASAQPSSTIIDQSPELDEGETSD